MSDGLQKMEDCASEAPLPPSSGTAAWTGTRDDASARPGSWGEYTQTAGRSRRLSSGGKRLMDGPTLTWPELRGRFAVAYSGF